MKPIKYIRHAKRRMNERRVNEAEVEMTISSPDYIEQSVKERYNAYSYINNRFLRVTYIENDTTIQIITVTIRKRPFKG